MNEKVETITILVKKDERMGLELRYDNLSDEECLEALQNCIRELKKNIDENDNDIF